MARTTVPPQMSVARNYEELCIQAVESIRSLAQKSIQEQKRFTIALSGGSTPEGVYSLMASSPYSSQFDWDKVHFFFGDERCVPWNNPRSNRRMAVNTLFSKIKIPPSNIHAIKTDTPDAQTSAFLYEKELIHYFALKPGEFPSFDLVLLGLGKDGHTASLFPGNPALEERLRLAVFVEAAGIPEKRVTLTLPVLNHAKAVFFLVSGPGKAETLKRVLEGKEKDLPAVRINPSQGKVGWFLDQAAVSLLERNYEPSRKK